MRPKVHAGRVEPHKKGLVFFRSALNELLRAVQKLEVDGFHAFFVKRTGIGHAAVRKTVHHTARPEAFAEGWVPRVVGVLGLFFCVQVIKIAKELVKAVLSWQELIAITKVVLAKLPRCIALLFQQRGEGHILRADTEIRAGHTHFGKASADG